MLKKVTIIFLLVALSAGTVFGSGQAEGDSNVPKVAVVVKTLTGDVFQLKLAEAARDRAIETGCRCDHISGWRTDCSSEDGFNH